MSIMQVRDTAGTFFKRLGGIFTAFTTRLTRAMTRYQLFGKWRNGQEHTLPDTTAHTHYQMWRARGGQLSKNLLMSFNGTYRLSQVPLRPYINNKRGGGANYLVTALETWSIIGLMLYFSRGMFGFFLPVMQSPTAVPNVVVSSAGPMYATPDLSSADRSYVVNPPSTPTAFPLNFVINVTTPTPEVGAGTVTPTLEPEVYHVAYSYYNPDLGGVNCHTANWDGSHCADTTASGIRWSEYIGRGVALAPEWLAVMGYGSVISVTSPPPLVGDYVVVDMCCGCSGGLWPDRTFRVDFLDQRQELPWASPVDFQIRARMPGLEAKYLSCSAGG